MVNGMGCVARMLADRRKNPTRRTDGEVASRVRSHLPSSRSRAAPIRSAPTIYLQTRRSLTSSVMVRQPTTSQTASKYGRRTSIGLPAALTLTIVVRWGRKVPMLAAFPVATKRCSPRATRSSAPVLPAAAT